MPAQLMTYRGSGRVTSGVAGFLVLRQDPETRAYLRMGRLWHGQNHLYTFQYDRRITDDVSVPPLPGFPDREHTYVSETLFATFSNRVMTPRRDTYQQYLRLLGLDSESPDPFEVLARTWGTRATDRIQLLPIPRVDSEGHLRTRFLVHGGSHMDPGGEALRTVAVGDRLELEREPTNPEDSRAVLVLAPPARGARRLGYIPRPLAPFVHALWDATVEPVVMAEHINLPGTRLASNQMRLLARLEAQVPPDFDVENALESGEGCLKDLVE